jgi:hypothetical protein
MTLPTQVDITPVDWGSWTLYNWTPGDTRMQCYCYHNKFTNHYLVELGEKTSTYRYSVYYNRLLLLTKIIKLECCHNLRACPIRYHKLPDSPCREVLRAEAIKAAHGVWVRYVTLLADSTTIQSGEL